MIRFALAAAALFLSTACIAQNSTALGNSGSSAAAGQFRPTGVGEPASVTPAAIGPDGMQPIPAVTINKDYRVGPNDLLDIEVLNLGTDGKRTVRVNAGGFVSMPLIGAVTVAGLTQQEVEAHIAGLYGEKYLQDPQVAVFIREFTTERITIDGAVSKPGIYPIAGNMTLLRALALAGGFGRIANETDVKVFRQAEAGRRQVATFDVERIRSGQAEDPVLRGDDLIVVQKDSTRAFLKDSVFRDIIDSINPFSVLR